MSALCNWIAGVELGAFELADHEQLQADGAAAEDENGLARGDTRLLDGFHDGVDGLDEGGFFEADVVGERHDAALGDPRHGFHVLGEAAAVWREARGQAGRFVLLALGKEAFFAVEAPAAGRVVKAHYAIAGRPFVYPATDRDDCAGEFVAEDLRRLDVALEDFLDVGAADAAGRDFDEDFAVADFGHGNFFDADDAFSRKTPARMVFGIGPIEVRVSDAVPMLLMSPRPLLFSEARRASSFARLHKHSDPESLPKIFPRRGSAGRIESTTECGKD